MTDHVGDIPLPVPVPEAAKADPDLDPVLGTLLAYMKGALNRQLGPAWKRIENPTVPFIRTTFAHDPARSGGLAFNRNDHPALYLWRESVEKEWWYTIDWRMRESTLSLLWVPWADPQQERKRVVHAMLGPFAGAIDLAIELGRDAGYVVRGDTDTRAPKSGSLIYGQGQSRLFRLTLGKVDRAIVEVKDVEKGNDTLHYEALHATFTIWERTDLDIAGRYSALTGLDMTELLHLDAADATPLPFVSPGQTLTLRDDFDPDA